MGQPLACGVIVIFFHGLICQECFKLWVLWFPPTVQLSKFQQKGFGLQLAGQVWAGV